MGLDSVLVITETLDENPVPVVPQSSERPRSEVSETDPVSLVRFPNVLVTKAAVAKMEEMWQ